MQLETDTTNANASLRARSALRQLYQARCAIGAMSNVIDKCIMSDFMKAIGAIAEAELFLTDIAEEMEM